MPLAIAANAVPIIAFAPIAGAWFGEVSPNSKIAIAAVLCFLPVMVNTLRGLQSANPRQIELMRSYAAGDLEIWRRVRVPTALPFVFTALKVASVLAMIGAIVGDYFGGAVNALGVQIENSISLFDFPLGWAAIVLEPVLGEGGIIPLTDEYLAAARRIADRFGAILIFDEIQCGLGRTGTLFAFQQSGVVPDIVTLAKPLGGGLPLGCVLTGEAIEGVVKPGHHGTTFGGNPIACAAALANLEVWESEPVLARIAELKTLQTQQLNRFREDPRFTDVRQTGTITAMDLKAPDGGYLANVRSRLSASFRDSNVLLRPLGNTIYVLPPYCVTHEDLETVYDAIAAATDAAAP